MARLIPQKQIEEVNQFRDSVGVSGSLIVSRSFDLGSDPEEPSFLTGDITVSGSIDIDGEFSVAGDVTVNATASNAVISENTLLFDGIASEDFGVSEPTIYVSVTNGSDINDGRTLQYPVKTIEKALEIVSASVAEDEDRGDDGRFGLDSGSDFSGYRIEVSAGTYREDNPMTIPPNTTIWGDGQRVTKILANNKNEDLFWVDSGVYLGEMTFGRLQVYPSVDDAQKGFAVAFKPNAFITTSPYVQNCALISNQENSFLELYEDVPVGGGGINIDGDRVNENSPLASMVLDAYTQVSPNGVGCQVNGRGFIQLVSFFTNFAAYGVKVLNGGQAVLLNSNTSFGDFGMYSSGSRFITGSGGNLDAFETVRDNYTIIIDTIEDGLISIPTGSSAVSNTSGGYYRGEVSQSFISGFSSASVADDAVTKFEVIESIIESGSYSGSIGQNYENFIKVTDTPQVTGFPPSPESWLESISSSFATVEDVILNPTASRSVTYNWESQTRFGLVTEAIDFSTSNQTIPNDVSASYAIITDALVNGTGSLGTGSEYTSPSTDPEIVSASQQLLDNIPFIQEETINYLNVLWSDLDYNEASCSRDIETIVSGAATDLLYNSDSASIASAKAYYEIPSKVNGEQKYLTINSIEYASGLSRLLIQGLPFTTPSGDIILTSDLIDDNKPFIQDETIAYISSSWTNFDYNEASCSRDIGYILDAARVDLLYGGNESSIQAGEFYNIFTSSATVGGTSTPNEEAQLQPTLDGIRYSGGTTENLVSGAIYQYPSQAVSGGVELLRSNREFIQEEVIEYLSSSWSEFDYNSVSCSRDVGLIVDGVATDLLYGGNYRSVTTGNFYYNIPSANIAVEEQNPQTLDGITFAKGTSQNVINQVQYRRPPFLNRESVEELLNKKEELKTRAIDFTNNAFPDFDYNEVSCSRDVGFIVDALSTDLLYGGNERSIKAAESYYTGVYGDASIVIDEQQYETAETNRFLRSQIQTIVRNARTEEFGSLIITTGHDFSYAGSGVTYKALPPNQGGNGTPDPDKEITELGGGRVYFTSGNELGDFRIGGGLVINQATGTLQGRTFSRSLFTLVTPFSLALQD